MILQCVTPSDNSGNVNIIMATAHHTLVIAVTGSCSVACGGWSCLPVGWLTNYVCMCKLRSLVTPTCICMCVCVCLPGVLTSQLISSMLHSSHKRARVPLTQAPTIFSQSSARTCTTYLNKFTSAVSDSPRNKQLFSHRRVHTDVNYFTLHFF